MVKNTSISLGPHFGKFIEQQISCGRYGSASEVMRAGLRLLEEREARLQALQNALEEGEKSGPSMTFDIESFLQAKHDSFNKE
ncbi:MAG: type II toxin-antitoxin system ParD family antitoxin [Advenella sp.]